MEFKEVRRSGRVLQTVPILLIGFDYEGRVFTEDTHTVMLSYHGAGIVSGHKLAAEQELVLRMSESQREAEIRVVGEIGLQGNLHSYGVAFLDEALDFWQIEFPPAPSLQDRPMELVLECHGCNATVTLVNGDYEFDVCAIHGGLVRYCAACGFATVWKRAEPGSIRRAAPGKAARKTAERPRTTPGGEPAAMPPAVRRETEEEALVEHAAFQVLDRVLTRPGAQAAQLTKARDERVGDPASQKAAKTAAALAERRQRLRAKVNYFACVRSDLYGDDMVTCVDMSRGGLGFWTKNPYEISAQVTIAVPFSPESPNAPAIFVEARIVNLAEAPERKMFRCGAAFLPVTGSRAHT